MEKWKLPDFSGWKVNYRNYLYLDVPTWSLVFSKTDVDNPPSTFEQDCRQYYWFGIETFFTPLDPKSSSSQAGNERSDSSKLNERPIIQDRDLTGFTDPTSKAEGQDYRIFDRGIFIKSWGFKGDDENWQTAILTPDGWRLFGKNIEIIFEFDFDNSGANIETVSISVLKNGICRDCINIDKIVKYEQDFNL